MLTAGYCLLLLYNNCLYRTFGVDVCLLGVAVIAGCNCNADDKRRRNTDRFYFFLHKLPIPPRENSFQLCKNLCKIYTMYIYCVTFPNIPSR